MPIRARGAGSYARARPPSPEPPQKNPGAIFCLLGVGFIGEIALHAPWAWHTKNAGGVFTCEGHWHAADQYGMKVHHLRLENLLLLALLLLLLLLAHAASGASVLCL